MTGTGTEKTERPERFPREGSATEIHLRSLLEDASPEEIQALQSLFTRGLGTVLKERGDKADQLIDDSPDSDFSTHETGQFSAYRDSERIVKDYATYLGSFVGEA